MNLPLQSCTHSQTFHECRKLLLDTDGSAIRRVLYGRILKTSDCWLDGNTLCLWAAKNGWTMYEDIRCIIKNSAGNTVTSSVTHYGYLRIADLQILFAKKMA